MRLLELFSGNKSVSKVFKEKYPDIEILSLDIEQKLNPDVCVDILLWNYQIYPEHHFDIIWASPDCRSWSIASGGKHRVLPDLEPKTETAVIGQNLIYKTLEIINYFNPTYWFIENPRGLLRHFEPMKQLPYCHLVYYGNHNYPMYKATNIWSNIFLWEDEKKQIIQIERDAQGKNKYFMNNKDKRSLIPSLLIERIIDKLNI